MTNYLRGATVTPVLQALNLEALKELVDIPEAVAEAPSPAEAFTSLVRKGAELQLSYGGLQAVLIAPDVSSEARAVRTRFLQLDNVALNATIEERRIRSEISIEQI